MAISPSKLREDIYNILDAVLENGEIVEVKRKGQIIKIVPPKKKDKLSSLISHPDAVVGDSDDFISMDWSREVEAIDRLIVANAKYNGAILISKDKNILEHYENAKW